MRPAWEYIKADVDPSLLTDIYYKGWKTVAEKKDDYFDSLMCKSRMCYIGEPSIIL